MFTLLTMYAFATPCEKAFTDEEVRGLAALAEDAFANLDADGFRGARTQLGTAVTCLSEPASPATPARYFLVESLAAHLDGSPDVARSNIAAFAELETLPPPTTVAPDGHPLRVAWQTTVDEGPSPRQPLPVPAEGRLWVDGLEILTLPASRPAIVQFVTTGRVAWTEIVAAGGTPPAYPLAPESARVAYTAGEVVPVERRKRYPIWLPVVAAGATAGAVGTWAASGATRATFKNLDSAEKDRISNARRTTNALVITSGGLGLVALGAAGVSVAAACNGVMAAWRR